MPRSADAGTVVSQLRGTLSPPREHTCGRIPLFQSPRPAAPRSVPGHGPVGGRRWQRGRRPPRRRATSPRSREPRRWCGWPLRIASSHRPRTRPKGGYLRLIHAVPPLRLQRSATRATSTTAGHSPVREPSVKHPHRTTRRSIAAILRAECLSSVPERPARCPAAAIRHGSGRVPPLGHLRPAIVFDRDGLRQRRVRRHVSPLLAVRLARHQSTPHDAIAVHESDRALRPGGPRLVGQPEPRPSCSC
jgi:hypothetical protein